MRNFYLKKKENLKKLKKKEDNIKNQINISINSIQKINVNKYPINYKIIKNKENDTKILTEKKRNYKSYFIDKDKENTRKNKVELKQKQNESELSILIGKINKEIYKNQRNYNTSISDCLNIDSHNNHNKNYSHKDYVNLKALNNNNNNNFKLYGSYTKDMSRDYSYNSFNRPSSYIKDQRKDSYNSYNNNNLIYKSFQIFPRNRSYVSNQTNPSFPGYRQVGRNYIKNRISNYILKNQYKQGYLSTDNQKENDNENDAKLIQVKKSLGSNYIKTLAQIRNDSLSKGKRKISPVCDNILESKGKEIFANSKNINNIDNYYNFWNDNDGHSGGKINLALNNPCRNKVDFLSSLYHIVKIQCIWRGYYLRKSLLTKNIKNPKLNIFYKQKFFITKIFKFIIHHNLKLNFEIFKEKIKNIEKNGYEVNSSLINNLSNCYHQIYKRNNNLLYNKKRLSVSNKNINQLNYNNFQLDMYTPKIKKQKTKLDRNYNRRGKGNTNNYKALKTNDICYQGNDKNNIINAKRNKKFVGILPDDKNTSHFSINNIVNINKKRTILSNIVKNRGKIKDEEDKNYISNNVKNDNINNYDNNENNYNNNINNNDNNLNNITNENENNYNVNKDKKNNCKNLKNINYNKNSSRNNKLKYKEYIYFLFLLFARIQKASHNLFFKELLDKLNEKKRINLKKDQTNKLLKIIKHNEKKTIKYYYRIFKEKVLTEKIKDIILQSNSYRIIGKNINNNRYFQIKNNNNIINNPNNNNMIINHKNIKNKFLSHSQNLSINSKNTNSNDMNNINNKEIDSNSHDLARQFSKKRYIKIKKLNRAGSVNPALTKSASNNKYNSSLLALSKSTCYTPRKKMVIKYKSGISTPIKNDEYYKFSPEFIMRKKVCGIILKFDKKQLKLFFKRWKVRTNCAKKKKFLIYFIMLMKEYFCNDKSIKSNKEYEMGKYMFFWYRKAFH